MPDWDEDSPELRKNLHRVLSEIARQAKKRALPSVASAKRWQSRFLRGLTLPDARFIGAFRGEAGLETVEVRVGPHFGVGAAAVADELAQFETRLRALVRELDSMLAAGRDPDADALAAILDLCAWAHSEWIRIHPFANGNGRTARLWANYLAMRYNLPPFIRLRPRPDSGYTDAGMKAMQGDWKHAAIVFRRLLERFLDETQ